MSGMLPVVYLARHGETARTVSRQPTGVTDLPLTPGGETEARRVGHRLEGLTFAAVLTNPLRRAVRTCQLAGFGSAAEVEPISWSGTTARTKVGPPPISTSSARLGSCSAPASP